MDTEIYEKVEYLKDSEYGIIFLESYQSFTSEEVPYSLVNSWQGYLKFTDQKIELRNEAHTNKARTHLFGKIESKEEILELIKDMIKCKKE